MESSQPNNVVDDVLGLDQDIKLTTRAKVARLDYDRVMDKNGLTYILQNHTNITKTISRRDKQFYKIHKGKPTKHQKYDHEAENLSKVLEFYQLWCHGLFPKANFKDCIALLRGLGAKLAPLKLYRRDMLNRELDKLKMEKGMVIEDDEHQDVLVNEDAEQSQIEPQANANEDEEDDDDWSFMNRPRIPRNNGLFLDDDDEDADDNPQVNALPDIVQLGTDQSTGEPPQSHSEPSTTVAEQQSANEESTKESSQTNIEPSIELANIPSPDPFSDDDDEIVQASISQPAEEEYPDEDDIEMDLMREFS